MDQTLQQPRSEELHLDSLLSSRQPEALSFATLLAILLAGRRTILYSGVGMLLVSAAVAFLMPNTYTATASFVPPGSNTGSSSAAALMGQLSGLAGGGMFAGKGQGDTYVGILKSHTIARDIIQRFGLMQIYKVKKESQAEAILAKNSAFTIGTKDPIVVISVMDKNPERARDLANGYLQALQNTANGLAITESSQRRLFYEQRLVKEKDDLANAEVALKQTEEKSGFIAPAGQTSSEIQTLALLQDRITDREVRLASMLQDETEQNPDVLRLREEIGKLKAQVAQLEIGHNQNQLGGFSNAQVPGLELEYIRKSRDVKYHEALFDIIARQYEAARMDEARDSPLQVLDRAVVPDTKSGPHRMLLMALGLLIGLIGGSAWTLLRELRAPATRL